MLDKNKFYNSNICEKVTKYRVHLQKNTLNKSVTFDLGVTLLSPLWQQGADVTMTSVPKVLDGQSDSSTGEEVTQPVTTENMEECR